MAHRILPRRMRLGVVSGCQVYVHISMLAWIPLLLLGFVDVGPLAILLASVFIHEYAHAACSRRVGMGGGSLILWVLGGAFVPTWLVEPPSRLRGKERTRYAAAVAAGPAVNLLLAGACFAAGWALNTDWLKTAALFNLGLGAVNLLPVPPLDGEQLLVLFATRVGLRRRDVHLFLAVAF